VLQKISKIIFLSLLFFFIFAIFNAEIWDPDFWWHLKTGEYIYQTKSLLKTDPFTYTSLTKDPINPDSPRIEFILKQYWLAQLGFYGVYKTFGLQGIVYMRACILTLLMFLIYKGIRREGIGVYLSLVLLMPVVKLFINFTGDRPQLFSFLFAFLLIYLLEGFRKSQISSLKSQNDTPPTPPLTKGGLGEVSLQSPVSTYLSVSQSQSSSSLVSGLRYLLPIPFLLLLWANMHGGFVVGIIIIVIYVVAETIKLTTRRFGEILPRQSFKALLIIAGIAILFSFINPTGYKVFSALNEFQKSLYMHAVMETKPLLTLLKYNYLQVETMSFVILLPIVLFLFLINLKKIDLTDVALFIFFTYMTLSAIRGVPFFMYVAILMVARYGRLTTAKIGKEKRFIVTKGKISNTFSFLRHPFLKVMAPITLSFLLILILLNGNFLHRATVRSDKYPIGAAKFLKKNKLSANMFNPYVWGGYLIWALYPDYKVFIDGRGLIEEVVFQSIKISHASPKKFAGIPEWKAMLQAYNIKLILTYAVAHDTGQVLPLIPALIEDPEWHLIYMDDNSLIFLKNSPENIEVIEKYDMPKEWAWNEVIIEATQKSKEYWGNANFYLTIGDAYLKKDNYREARSAYLKASELYPQNEKVKEKLQKLENLPL